MNFKQAQKAIDKIDKWITDEFDDNPLEQLRIASQMVDVVSELRSTVAMTRVHAVSQLGHMSDIDLANECGVHRSNIYRLKKSAGVAGLVETAQRRIDGQQRYSNTATTPS
jgi:hypothetical protein